MVEEDTNQRDNDQLVIRFGDTRWDPQLEEKGLNKLLLFLPE